MMTKNRVVTSKSPAVLIDIHQHPEGDFAIGAFTFRHGGRRLDHGHALDRLAPSHGRDHPEHQVPHHVRGALEQGAALNAANGLDMIHLNLSQECVEC